MSAENAWQTAKDEIAKACPLRVAANVVRLPMPPAFRAEVEAEAEELRALLADVKEALPHILDRGETLTMRKARTKLRKVLSRLEAKGEPRPAGWGEGGKGHE